VHHSESRNTLNRRQFVRWAGLGAASSIALVAAACQPAPSAPSVAPTSAGATQAPATIQPAGGAAAASTPNATQQQPVTGGTLTMALSAEVVDLDPANRRGVPSAAAEHLLYNGLVNQSPDQQIKPDLALSWSAQDTVWTFKLRQGVRFHDGTPFNAAAVKYTWDRYLGGKENVQRASDWTPYVDSVSVVDDSTVQFNTKNVDAFFLDRIAAEAGIVSPTAHEKLGKDFMKSPVGTGPFKFKDWTSGVSFSAVRNDDYYGDKAHLDGVVIRAINDADTRALSLGTNEIQLASGVTPEEMPRLQSNPNLTVVSRATALNLMFGMNNLKKPFDDVRVRQALNYAIDRDSIVKNVFQGLAAAMQGAVPPVALDYAPVQAWPYDPNKAKQMLADAGLATGFSATLTGTQGRYFKDYELMQAVQQYLKAVGVTTTINIVEWARYLELVGLPPDNTPMEMWLDGWNGNTADSLFNQRWGCNAFTPKGVNVHGFCDQSIDQSVQQAERTLDDTQRGTLLAQAQQTLSTDAPSIWGFTTNETAGMSKKLHGVLVYPSELVTADEHTWMES
jgi:ABC-type transport system substrate-binding protein